MNPSSVDQVAASIAQFEDRLDIAILSCSTSSRRASSSACLLSRPNPGYRGRLAKATIYSRLMSVKAFFVWLAGQPGYKSRLTYSDMDYFNPSNNDGRIARATRERPAPTLEQIRRALSAMPARLRDLEKRDRAVSCVRHLERRPRRRDCIDVDSSCRLGPAHRLSRREGGSHQEPQDLYVDIFPGWNRHREHRRRVDFLLDERAVVRA